MSIQIPWAALLLLVPLGAVAQNQEEAPEAENPAQAVEALLGSSSDFELVERASPAEVAACRKEKEDPLCTAVAKVCTGTGSEPASCKEWQPPESEGTLGGPKLLGGGVKETVKIPPDLLASLRTCLQNPACSTLKDFKDLYLDRYIDLRLWCEKEAYLSVRTKPGVDHVCDAIEDYEKKVSKKAAATFARLRKARGTLEDAQYRADRLTATVARFAPYKELIQKTKETRKQLRDAELAKLDETNKAWSNWKDLSNKPGTEDEINAAKAAYEANLKAYKQSSDARQSFDDSPDNQAFRRADEELTRATEELVAVETKIAEAKDLVAAEEKTLRIESGVALVYLEKVDRFRLKQMEQTISRPVPRCGGWGLTVPLISTRYTGGGRYEVKGPIEAGIGAGYYADVTCSKESTFGFQAFLFSEGLDPSKKFHVAMGVGTSLAAFKYFHFGLAAGYDLFRHEGEGDNFKTSGLITTKPVTTGNLSVLFTFNVRSESETQESEEPAATAENKPPPQESAGGG